MLTSNVPTATPSLPTSPALTVTLGMFCACISLVSTPMHCAAPDTKRQVTASKVAEYVRHSFVQSKQCTRASQADSRPSNELAHLGSVCKR
jgi:hypothetical protein